jgi:hypothetical protein
MRSGTFILAAIAVLGGTPVQAAECIVAGYPTTFGVDMNGSFEVDSGESCHYAFDLRGAVESSKILSPAKNGTVRMLNLSSFEYKPHAGYKGADSFAIEATGESLRGKGTSVVTMNVRVK